jgi:hypothetical protein
MSYLNQKSILQELVTFLRNQDVMTTTIRGVTTTIYTATLTGATTSQISVTNVKNIRSLTIDAVSKSFGTDYTYNMDYGSSPATLITFTSAQTGALSVSYDYGSDKIFPDYPQASLTLNSFPRIAVDFIDFTSEPAGFGNVMETKIHFTVVVYSPSMDDVRDYISTIRSKFGAAWTSFYYMGGVIRVQNIGPLIISENKHNKVFQQNIDFECKFNYESN